MPYIFKSSSNEKVVLERKPVSGFIFIVVGIVFVLAGTALFYFLDPKPPYVYFMVIAPVMGCTAIYAGLNVSRQNKKTIPKLIVFSNEDGYIRIQQGNDASESGFIPYEEIDKIEIKIKQYQDRTGNNNLLSSTNTVYTYHVILLEKISASGNY